MNKLLALGAFCAVMLAGAPAMASTDIDVSQVFDMNDVMFNVTTQDFVLGADYASAVLRVTSAIADDDAVVQINGVNIFGFGIRGPGDGFFYFDPLGASTPFHFDYDNGPINHDFSGPFVEGLNTIKVYVNNNFDGINPGNGPLTDGPFSLEFNAVVTNGVPEPGTWALSVLGIGLMGGVLRRGRAAGTLARA